MGGRSSTFTPTVEYATNRTQSEHRNAIERLRDNERFPDGTYDIRTLESCFYTDGYQVTFCQLGDNYTDEEYRDLCNEFLSHSMDGRIYAGKFGGEPEISFRVASKRMAMKLARKYNQISIWDWSVRDDVTGEYEGAPIETGGTGRRSWYVGD